MKQLNEQINAKYVMQARKLAQYNHLLREILPVECLNHVTVAGFSNQTLTVLTDSPVWATRLRQLSPKILAFLREKHTLGNSNISDIVMFHHINIKTRYSKTPTEAENQSKKSSQHKPVISQKTATLLEQSADSIDDEKLSDALKRLAQHQRNETK